MTRLHVLIDRERCTSCGDCVLSVPEVFDLDDHDAKVILLNAEPDISLADALEQAADDCPTDVIEIRR
ncbi:ferredoxin [Nocardia sp. R7R-8]|uniref:ferredoxin n=1 Tax=Nocardia sp. R7R-8 TaxID=3459304 RepID=UPI00403E1301